MSIRKDISDIGTYYAARQRDGAMWVRTAFVTVFRLSGP